MNPVNRKGLSVPAPDLRRDIDVNRHLASRGLIAPPLYVTAWLVISLSTGQFPPADSLYWLLVAGMIGPGAWRLIWRSRAGVCQDAPLRGHAPDCRGRGGKFQCSGRVFRAGGPSCGAALRKGP